MADTFTTSIDDFVEASEWLSDVHKPAVTALRAMAAQLDGGDLAPALLGQFGLMYRALLKEAPRVDSVEDPLEVALQEAAGG